MLEKYATVRKLKSILEDVDGIQKAAEYSSDFGFIVYCSNLARDNPIMFIPLSVDIVKTIYDTQRIKDGKKTVITNLFECLENKLRKKFVKF